MCREVITWLEWINKYNKMETKENQLRNNTVAEIAIISFAKK